MSTEARAVDLDEATTGGLSDLDQRRSELTARLRAARAVLSPKAAVAAAATSGDTAEAAKLAEAVVAQARSAQPGFQPRSMTMKLILERPDVTLRVVVAIVTLLFGARMSRHFNSAATMIYTLRQTLDVVSGKPFAR